VKPKAGMGPCPGLRTSLFMGDSLMNNLSTCVCLQNISYSLDFITQGHRHDKHHSEVLHNLSGNSDTCFALPPPIPFPIATGQDIWVVGCLSEATCLCLLTPVST
jgi:hypothetical protein